MKSKLNDRLEALESAMYSKADAVDDAAREEADADLLAKLLAELTEEDSAYAALDAAGRIQHWQEHIEAARRYIEKYSDHAPPMGARWQRTPTMESMHLSFWQSDLQDARDDLRGGECWYELTAARLDRLAELHYDQGKLDRWNATLMQYKNLPWQWRADDLELPIDALQLLDS